MKLKAPLENAVDLRAEMLALMGDSSDVRHAIDGAVSGVEWMDWGGALRSDHGWIEFLVPADKAEVYDFTVRTSHQSDHGWESGVIKRLCSLYNLVAVDRQTSAFVGVGTTVTN